MRTTPEVVSLLKEMLAERFGILEAQLTDEARLQDLNLDSMYLVDIVLDMETSLGVALNNLDLPRNPSIAELAAAISGNRAATERPVFLS